MVAWAAVIPAVASIASSAIGAFGGGSNSALGVDDQKSLMDYQQKLNWQNSYIDYLYNIDYMNRQYNYNKNLSTSTNRQNFQYNKWFSQNAYANTMKDLKKSGLNPLLAIGNGANMGSVSAGANGSVGLSSAHTNPSGLLDPSTASSAKAQQLQAKLGIVNAINQTIGTISSSSKAVEEAKTEENKRENLDADSALKSLQGYRQIIENSNLDNKMKSEILRNLGEYQSLIVGAQAQKALLPYVIKEKSASAYSLIKNADVAGVNAETNKFNAITERSNSYSRRFEAKNSNPWKSVMNIFSEPGFNRWLRY